MRSFPQASRQTLACDNVCSFGDGPYAYYKKSEIGKKLMVVDVLSKPGGLRRVASRLFYRSIKLAPRATNPYATHLPVLCAMGAVVEPARIVEFGSGLISTCGFQNRVAFPELACLDTFENDPDWYPRVFQQVGDDSRVKLSLMDAPMKEVVKGVDFKSADLIFVDDSKSHEERARTIQELAKHPLRGIPIVVHDFENWRIRWAVRRFDHVFSANALNPQAGVIWNGVWEGQKALGSINALIKEHSGSIVLDDSTGWAQMFRSRLGRDLLGVGRVSQ